MEKLGIMGGTFDPPHIGHLLAAETVAENLGLKRVIFIPTGRISYKDSSRTSPQADRFNMTRLAISGNPLFEISDMEVREEDFGYTYKTLERLAELRPEAHLYFIVGADSLDYMDVWREPERIFEMCTVAAVNREGFLAESSVKKADELKNRFGADIRLISMPNVGISSSDIRRRVGSGKSIRYMVTNSVYEYIAQKGLYSEK